MKFDKENENYIYYLAGKNLRKYRKLAGLTQSELADKSNYSVGFISNMENDYHQTFSLGTLYKLANVLNIDIREFFNELDEKESK